MFAVNPSVLGREGSVVLGKKSGKLSIIYSMEKLGITGVPDEIISLVLADVKIQGIEKKRLLTQQEFIKILEKHDMAAGVAV